MNLKIGGSNVGKIMYNGQEFGGTTKLEPGMILYMSEKSENGFENLHLLSTTKNWNNLNGINVMIFDDNFLRNYINVNTSGYDFKNLNINKPYRVDGLSLSLNISTSIVDGEYRLNVDTQQPYKFIIKTL